MLVGIEEQERFFTDHRGLFLTAYIAPSAFNVVGAPIVTVSAHIGSITKRNSLHGPVPTALVTSYTILHITVTEIELLWGV